MADAGLIHCNGVAFTNPVGTRPWQVPRKWRYRKLPVRTAPPGVISHNAVYRPLSETANYRVADQPPAGDGKRYAVREDLPDRAVLNLLQRGAFSKTGRAGAKVLCGLHLLRYLGGVSGFCRTTNRVKSYEI